ncbi:hypothetical protein FRB94_012908 [Tulasnella sp. JGI-2019a]|nr:hypothetical protein FRB93_001609 [Tulasnella sp. JGI-2019a]KAG9008811.1 hypothetical protein FRB94_012908 [Tulasnella sp. JGI-2019a]KAG9034027.1 hypothetical protein FRB95_013898 [Tulasnella sp. JGI-2019a]
MSQPHIEVPHLRVPDKASFEKIIRATRSAYSTRPQSNTPKPQLPERKSLLVDKPFEITKLVFASIDDLWDATSLGLTCKHMLDLSLDRINQLLPIFTAPWAGDRLICIGDYADNDDMPPGALTREEMTILKDNRINLYRYGFSFEQIDGEKLWGPDGGFFNRLSWVEKMQFEAIVGSGDEMVDDVVLCNLSKQEYFWLEIVKEHGRAGFGAFLLSQICWSSDSSVSMRSDHVFQGRWAGDRFEIITINRLKGNAEDWEVVSESLLAEMVAIWDDDPELAS